MTEDEEIEVGLDVSFEFLFYLSSELTWQKRKLKLYFLRVLSFVLFEFQVNLTEDEEAGALLDASFGFMFDTSSK